VEGWRRDYSSSSSYSYASSQTVESAAQPGPAEGKPARGELRKPFLGRREPWPTGAPPPGSPSSRASVGRCPPPPQAPAAPRWAAGYWHPNREGIPAEPPVLPRVHPGRASSMGSSRGQPGACAAEPRAGEGGRGEEGAGETELAGASRGEPHGSSGRHTTPQTSPWSRLSSAWSSEAGATAHHPPRLPLAPASGSEGRRARGRAHAGWHSRLPRAGSLQEMASPEKLPRAVSPQRGQAPQDRGGPGVTKGGSPELGPWRLNRRSESQGAYQPPAKRITPRGAL